MKTITIVGSGLAGTLLALYLARRGYLVELFESREDARKTVDKGRSINLAMSCRGKTGLAVVNLLPEIEKIMVPMRARAIHQKNGEIHYQAFGRHKDEYISAVLRSELNKLLLNKAEQEPQITIHFLAKLIHIDIHQKKLLFEDKNGSCFSKPYQLLIGADGAGSQVRETLANEKIISAYRKFLPHGYKELSISKKHSQHFAPEHLHLWPRKAFMLLGNPNCDHSITGTLFLPNEGANSFASLENDDAIRLFFKTVFPDAYKVMPNLIEEFNEHPTGGLSTVTCSSWYYEDHCLLIGDAAHGIVPFFGQGMNSAFEDCRILNEMLSQYEDNWQQAIPAFFSARKPNTDAVAEMSMDNYHEIQTGICDPKFNLKKQLEQELMHRYPTRYISKHVLVMFTNVPYATAKVHGIMQAELLNKICSNVERVEQIDWCKTDKLMQEYDKKLSEINSFN